MLRGLDPLAATGRLPIARLRGVVEQDPWIALILDDVDGRNPATPWADNELTRALTAVDVLADALTPAPIAAPDIEELLSADFTPGRGVR